MPSVSVVLPTYNRPNLLGRALGTVRAQTETGWEVVCVDDGSTEDVEPVLASFGDARIRLIRLPTNRGVGHARNVGIQAARAEVVTFLDDDNEWAPTLLQTLLERLGRADSPSVVHCAAHRLYDATGRSEGRRFAPLDGDILPHLLTERSLPMSCIAVRRCLLLEHGGFDEAMPALQDYDLLLRLAAAGAVFAGVARVLTVKHERPSGGSISSDVNRLRRGARVLDAKWADAIRARSGLGGYRRWRARLWGSVEFAELRRAVTTGRRLDALRRAAILARFLPLAPAYPLRAGALATFGPRAYDRAARWKDWLVVTSGGMGAETR